MGHLKSAGDKLDTLVLAALDWTAAHSDLYFVLTTRQRALVYWLIASAIINLLAWSSTWPHIWDGP